ncbi:MAG: sugar ABC transporter ATP-binding protein [Aliishimia sp.]
MLDNVEKRFGATVALTGVDLAIYPGEVHALVGENGAGKSTLGKMLTGVHSPDRGALKLDGAPIHLSNPAESLAYGLVGITQELSLMPTRNVTDNIMLARELGRGPFVNDAANRAAALAVMDKYGLAVDPDVIVADLPVSSQQRVEILRALSRDARMIVFDEPTARLSAEEAQTVCDVVRQLAAAGCAVVYVSHFLEEVLAISDRITILRNGKHIRTGPASNESRESLIEAMTGSTLSDQFPTPKFAPPDAEEMLRVDNLRLDGTTAPINLAIKAGEILGLSGLVGAGRSEIGQAILGALPAKGTVALAGQDISAWSIAQRIEQGIAYIPESRRDQGLMMMRTIQENVGLPYLSRISGWFGLSHRADTENARINCENATVKYGALSDDMTTLSGGNQQKVLFARARLGAPKLLIVDEPTRGVDVGAKRKIYDLVADMAAGGAAVLLISSEMEEIVGLCHRVEVIANGTQVANFQRNQMTEAALIQAAFSGV